MVKIRSGIGPSGKPAFPPSTLSEVLEAGLASVGLGVAHEEEGFREASFRSDL